jgi:hypothetical protein
MYAAPKTKLLKKNGDEPKSPLPFLLAASMRHGTSGVALDCLKTARTYYA